VCSEIIGTDDKRKLYTIFTMSDIVAGYEQRSVLPEAGKDREWIRENLGQIKKRAFGFYNDTSEKKSRIIQLSLIFSPLPTFTS
jgi:hypothetical protein